MMAYSRTINWGPRIPCGDVPDVAWAMTNEVRRLIASNTPPRSSACLLGMAVLPADDGMVLRYLKKDRPVFASDAHHPAHKIGIPALVAVLTDAVNS